MSFTTSATLTQLINFLTRPLILTHPAITVAHLQLMLHANLSCFLPFTPVADASLADNKNQKLVLSPFTLHLSPRILPIPPIYAGCLSSGISWDEWIRVLTAGLGNDVYVFVMEGCIRVGVPKTNVKEGEQGLDMIELWREQEEKKLEPSSMALKLRATLSSVHARKAAAQASVLSTTSTTTTTTRACFSSPDSTVDSPSSSTSSDVDYDSDNESTTSSSYSAVSKFSSRSSESMTSVSTSCSEVVNDDEDDKNKNNDRVFYRRPGAATTKPPAAVAAVVSRQRSSCTTTSKTTFATRNKAESHRPQSTPTSTSTIRKLAPKSRYMYAGGETGVVTGGVMLGSSSPATSTTTTLRSSSKGVKEGSWRASSSGSSSKGTKKNASAAVSENWRRRV
ncbi:hypothetical protein K435DRAFT_844393 [Dendrothele bispora CBS 962.96]|uniref:Anti-proliferative protein domain-containing protein n=1 Tax=Dendrothele bispora (strain CBS 962.96) TaxID=1314807 RepID=A0A4S8L2F2_DENBC|nr:hypothetical protein K435DRAFT_844393 [Dendrothele bispora CBS 962.96]